MELTNTLPVMRKIIIPILTSLFLFSCSAVEKKPVHILVNEEILDPLQMYQDFDLEQLQNLTGLSEQDSVNVNYEINGKTVLFSLINRGKTSVIVGKQQNVKTSEGEDQQYYLEGTEYKNLTMVTISLHEEHIVNTGDKFELEVEFEEYGNYLVGFLYHMENGGTAITNIRWKYSEIFDLGK
ncbi:MAG: hypothetical protein ACI9J3_000049 [Parvicellaceae bacterium]|jgi:hypothetical protein